MDRMRLLALLEPWVESKRGEYLRDVQRLVRIRSVYMDVVPEGEGWSSDPYEPVIREGKYIFGRGTADNKAPTLVALYAMRFLHEQGIRLRHPVLLVYGATKNAGCTTFPSF